MTMTECLEQKAVERMDSAESLFQALDVIRLLLDAVGLHDAAHAVEELRKKGS